MKCVSWIWFGLGLDWIGLNSYSARIYSVEIEVGKVAGVDSIVGVSIRIQTFKDKLALETDNLQLVTNSCRY